MTRPGPFAMADAMERGDDPPTWDDAVPIEAYRDEQLPPLESIEPGEWFSGREFTPQKLGTYVAQAGNIRIGTDGGRLYRYDRGVYRADGDTYVRHLVRLALRDRLQARHFTEVLAWLKAEFPSINGAPPLDRLNVANGLLDWRTGALTSHDPRVPSTIQLPVAWDATSTCPQIDKFLSEVLPADAVQLVIELAGYMLYPGNPLRRSVLLLGAGRNGKSKLLALFKALAGADNVSAVPLQVLAENRFAGADLYGKLANIAGDLDARAIKRSDLFKMMTGGDPIRGERKNAHAFNFVPFALPLFSANEAPISSDQSEAWFDRWLIIPFDRRFTEAEADPHLEAKLLDPRELQGFLVRAVDGLRSLMARGRFDLPESVTAAGARYRTRLDTARAFVEEECLLGPDFWTPRSHLYKAYKSWCQDQGRYALSAAAFNDKVLSEYGPQVEESGRKGIRGWRGLGRLAVVDE